MADVLIVAATAATNAKRRNEHARGYEFNVRNNILTWLGLQRGYAAYPRMSTYVADSRLRRASDATQLCDPNLISKSKYLHSVARVTVIIDATFCYVTKVEFPDEEHDRSGHRIAACNT